MKGLRGRGENMKKIVVKIKSENLEIFGGDIASAQVYSSALTVAQILQNYNAQKNRFI